MSLLAYPEYLFEGCNQNLQAIITKNFCVLHNTVEHNYISSSSTLGLQLHVSTLYVGHLQVDLTFGAAIQDVWGVLLGYWGLGGGDEISLFH